MSCDIFIWREQAGAALDPTDVLDSLQDTVELPGIVPLQRDAIVAAFREQFPDIAAGDVDIEWEGDGSYFQVGFTFLDERRVTLCTIYCGYELLKSSSAMKRLAAVAVSLGCRFYDPQQ